jgi:hypothetical protein
MAKKEEPAWKAELEIEIARSLKASGIREIGARVMARDAVLPAAWAAIKAAEQRGFSAGVSKSGDTVARLREELKAAEHRGHGLGLTVAAQELTAMANLAMEEADRNGGRTRASDPKYNKAAILFEAAKFFAPDKP